MALRHQLLRHGYEVLETGSGENALELVRSERIDVLILDLVMPEKSGMDVLREIKADEALASIPVLLLTAVAEREQLVTCLDLGADDYLVKPWDRDELRARLRSMVRLRSAIRASLESNRRARALLNATAHVSILLDQDGIVLAANEDAARLFSTSVAEMEGQRLLDLDFATQLEWSRRIDSVIRTASRHDFEEQWGDRKSVV